MGGTERTILIAYGAATVVAILGSLALVASTRNRRPIDTHRLAEFMKSVETITPATPTLCTCRR